MAAKNLNAITVAKLKYMHAGKVIIDDGTDEHTIGFIEPSSLNITWGGAPVTPERNLSALTGKGRRGADQPCGISFQLNPNTDGLIKDAVDHDDIKGVVDPDSRTGKKASVTTYTMYVEWWDDLAETSGVRGTLTNCYHNGDITIAGSGEGADGDSLNLNFISMSDDIVFAAVP